MGLDHKKTKRKQELLVVAQLEKAIDEQNGSAEVQGFSGAMCVFFLKVLTHLLYEYPCVAKMLTSTVVDSKAGRCLMGAAVGWSGPLLEFWNY